MANPNSPEAQPAPAPVEERVDDRLLPEDIKGLMSFDPFAPPPKEGTDAEAEGRAAQTRDERPDDGSEVRQPAEAAAQPTPAPQPEAKPQVDEAAELRRRLDEQNALIQRLLAKETPQPQPKAEPEQPAKPEAPAYNVQLPQELKQALTHEDENMRGKALDVLVNSLMNKLHQDFEQRLTERMQSLVQEMPAVVQQYVSRHETENRINNDIVAAYPKVGTNGQLRDMLLGTIRNIAEQRRAAGIPVQWGPDIMEAGITALEQSLGFPLRETGAPVAPTTTGRQPARTQFAGGGTPARGNGKVDSAFGLDLLSS